MKIKAGVLYAPNTDIVIETVDLDEPKEGEVLVRIVATGVCHSDYHIVKGEWRPPLPMVLGHEAAGVIERVGPRVTRSQPGDHVIINFRPNCGWCRYCTIGRPVLCSGSNTDRWVMLDGTVRLHKDGRDLFHFSRTASYAEYAVIAETGAVPIRKDMPLDKASLISCAVMTGVGSVINSAKVEAGSSVVVIGCGGIGLNVIQGAALAGAGEIIAVDVLESKLAYAREFGATQIIDATRGDTVERIRDLTNGGVDYAFEAIGNPKTIRQAYESVHLGGTAVIVGMAAEDEELSINALSMPRNERVLMGSWYGGARPWVDLPKMADLYMSGKIKIDEMISRTYKLDEINQAFKALEAGEVARSVVVFDT